MKTIFQFSVMVLLLGLFMPPSQANDADSIEEKEQLYNFDTAPEYPVIAEDWHPVIDSTLHPKQQEINYATMNPVDYGFAGAVTLAAIGLITWMIKSDRTDRKSLISAIDMLRNSIEAQRQSQDRLSSEIHSIVKGFEARIDSMEDGMRRLEDAFRNEIRRS